MFDEYPDGIGPSERAEKVNEWTKAYHEHSTRGARLQQLALECEAYARHFGELIKHAEVQANMEQWPDEVWEEQRAAQSEVLIPYDESVREEDVWRYEGSWIDEIPTEEYRDFMIARVSRWSIDDLRALWSQTKGSTDDD